MDANYSNNQLLVLVDLSAWLYMVVFHSVNEWAKKSKDEYAAMVHDPEDTDQENLPNLLVSDSFKRILKNSVARKLSTLDWLLKKNYQNEIDLADSIWTIFVSDDYTKNSFRKTLYPEYKAQRSLTKRSYDYYAIRDYVVNVVFPDLNLSEKNIFQIGCAGAEADDVIATVVRSEKFRNYMKIIVSSDGDFCQLHGTPGLLGQINIFGDEVVPWIDKKRGTKMSPAEALLVKIITGDGSDNIPQLWPKVGLKKALNLIRDPAKLRQKILESGSVAEQYKLNKSLIDMSKIPSELTVAIEKAVSKKFDDEKVSSTDVSGIEAAVEFDLMAL